MKTLEFRTARILLVLLLLLLSLWVGTSVTSGASLEPAPAVMPALQQSGSFSRDVTFKEMGYPLVRTLHGPYDSYSTAFSIPDDWSITDGYIDLKMSYSANMTVTSQDKEQHASLAIEIDGRALIQHLVVETPNEQFVLRVPLPPDVLNDPDTRGHELTIYLDTTYICVPEYRFALTLSPDSNLHLEYQQLPAYPDLAKYPRPIYGGNLLPNSVLFVLSQRPSQTELSSAAAIAAKLGQTIGSKLVISATTDAELNQQLAANSYVFVIGTPDNNQLISKLNADGLLPVKVKPSTAQLQIQGPAQFPDDGMLNYKIAVTNNTQVPLAASTLEVILPPEIKPLACSPSCELGADGRARRSLTSVDVGQTTEISLTLTVSQPKLSTVDTTISLVTSAHEPLSVVTWSTPVTGSASATSRTSPAHLFTYADRGVDQVMPEVDGIVQELVSPWNPARLVMVVSGSTAEGLTKAARALSTRTYFPGMSGSVAMVRGVNKALSSSKTPMTDFTLADIDYRDKTIYGFGPIETDYWFNVPYGWTLTSDAQILVRFRHSQVPKSVREASLTALINGTPVRSVNLGSDNEEQGVLAVPLAGNATWGSNLLTIVSNYEPDYCVYLTVRTNWVTILSSSEIQLRYLTTAPELDLSDYTLPYSASSDLSDLIFVLPNPSSTIDREVLLNLAATFGASSDGDGYAPKVIFNESDIESMKGNQIIAIGRPSVNPVIQRLNDALPQPFIQGTDQILQTMNTIVFSGMPSSEIGLIEQVPSIWDPTKTVLIVTGTSDQGVQWAGNALTKGDTIKGSLDGNLAAVRELEVNSYDTRVSRGGLVQPPAPYIAAPSPVAEATTPPSQVDPTPSALPEATEVAVEAVPQNPLDTEWRLQIAMAILLLMALILGTVWWRRKRY